MKVLGKTVDFRIAYPDVYLADLNQTASNGRIALTNVASVDEGEEPERKYPWQDMQVQLPPNLLLERWIDFPRFGRGLFLQVQLLRRYFFLRSGRHGTHSVDATSTAD